MAAVGMALAGACGRLRTTNISCRLAKLSREIEIDAIYIDRRRGGVAEQADKNMMIGPKPIGNRSENDPLLASNNAGTGEARAVSGQVSKSGATGVPRIGGGDRAGSDGFSRTISPIETSIKMPYPHRGSQIQREIICKKSHIDRSGIENGRALLKGAPRASTISSASVDRALSSIDRRVRFPLRIKGAIMSAPSISIGALCEGKGQEKG